jgi:drug/metabolite transporter (DMT)-like permease
MTDGADTVVREATRADPTTLAAFLAMVIIGGSNAVAVRFSNEGLPPFWGAASRFLIAAAIFWTILVIRRVALPRGRALAGAVLYGTLAVGASYALGYWGLMKIQASLFMVILSLGPLFTMMFAVAHRLEAFRWRGLAGSLLALAGIAIGIGTELGRSVPVASLVAVVVAAASMAEASVVYKLFPGTKPLPTNAVAFATGGVILLAISAIAGEAWQLPSDSQTVVAFAYLATAGTVGLFYLYLLVLSRWTASATSYAFLLFPVATVAIAATLTGERVTWQFIVGAVIAMAGVWVGAFHKKAARPAAEAAALDASGRCDPPYPGCA